MDPQKQPFSPADKPRDPAMPGRAAEQPGGIDDLDEAKAAAILGVGVGRPHNTTGASGPGMPPAAATPSAPTGAGGFPPGQPGPSAPFPPTGRPEPMGAPAPVGMVAPKKSKKLPLIGGIVAALLLILAGAGAAAYFVILNKPQHVFNMALVNSFSPDKVKSAAFDGEASLTMEDGPAYTMTFKGASNNEGALEFAGEVDALVTTLTADVRSTDGKSFYVRVGGLDGLPELFGISDDADADYLASIINAVNNQWLQVNESMVQQLTGTASSLAPKWSEAEQKKFVDIYKKNQFLVVDKALEDEDVNGQKSHHYRVIIEKAKLKAFAADLKAANLKSFKIDNRTLRSFTKEVDKADFKKYPIDVWIAKEERLINQLGFSFSDDISKLDVRYTIKDYNKPVNVTAPKDAKSLLEVISEVWGGAANGLQQQLQSNPATPNSLNEGITL